MSNVTGTTNNMEKSPFTNIVNKTDSFINTYNFIDDFERRSSREKTNPQSIFV